MGDLFFVIKMCIYTLVIVVLMQVKIGPTTIEQKVIEITHQSQLAGVLQGVAQGAAAFIGDQYKAMRGQVNSQFIEQHSASQIPGERLKAKVEEIKKSLKKDWVDKKDQIKEKINQEVDEFSTSDEE